MINLSENALKYVKDQLEINGAKVFRSWVENKSGHIVYAFGFDQSEPYAYDVVFEFEGVTFVVDDLSYLLLKDSEISYDPKTESFSVRKLNMIP